MRYFIVDGMEERLMENVFRYDEDKKRLENSVEKIQKEINCKKISPCNKGKRVKWVTTWKLATLFSMLHIPVLQ